MEGCINPRTYTQSHTPTVVQGRGWLTPPPLEFLIHCSISKRFCLQWKAFDLLSTRWGIFYWWWRCWRSVTSPNMVAISAAILDFIKNWIQVKTVRISFLRLTCKITKIITLHHFIHKLYFYSWKKLKKHTFSLKNGLTTCYLWRHIS